MSRSQRVAKNVFVSLVTQLLLWTLTFTVTLYLPAYLKDTGLGIITLVGSYATIFNVFVNLGTSTVLIKEISRNRARLGELVFASLLTRFVLGLLALLIGWAGVHLLRYPPSLQLFAMIALGVMLLGQLGDVLTCALGGLEEFPKVNVALLIDRVVFSSLTILLVLLRRPLWMFIAVSFVSSAGSIGFTSFTLRRHLAIIPRVPWTTVKSLLQAGIPFLALAVFTAVYGQSDALLLSKLSGVAAIGWYSLAKRLGGSPMVIPVALTGTMLPTLSRMHHEGGEGFNAAVRRLINLMLICVIPFSAILILAPGQILSVLHYPASYRNSIPVLMLSGGALILWFLSQAVGTALIASDRQAVFSRITGIAALVSVPLCAGCILLTQKLMANGAMGAMLSDVLLELFMVTAYILALPKGIFEWRLLSVLGRTSLAALPLALSLYGMHKRSDIFLPVCGVVFYAFACYWLRCLCAQDVNALRQILRRFSRA